MLPIRFGEVAVNFIYLLKEHIFGGEALRFQFTKELWSFSSLQTACCASLPVWADRHGTEPRARGTGHPALRNHASSGLCREGRVSLGFLHNPHPTRGAEPP